MSEKLPEQTAEARTDELTDGQLEGVSGGLDSSRTPRRFCRYCNKLTTFQTKTENIGNYTRTVYVCDVCNKYF